MFKFKKEHHFTIYFIGLALLSIGMPLSVFLVSVSQLILIGNWIVEGDFKNKIAILKERKSILIFIGVFLVHVLWLISTEDMKYAYKDIRIKLPLIILPIIIGTSCRLTFKQIKSLLLIFTGAIILSSLISTSILLGFTSIKINDIREISIFISHIRFSLLINISIFSLAYFLLSSHINRSNTEKVIYTISLIWLIVFLFILQSLTGIITFITTGYFLLLYKVIKLKKVYYRICFSLILVSAPVIIYVYLINQWNEFYTIDSKNIAELPLKTKKGNPYFHDINNNSIENGHWICLYVNFEELREDWPKYSNISIDGEDKRDQKIINTLFRYLTSKNLPKDAEGLSKLSKEDIQLIENGVTNYLYKDYTSLNARIHQTIWEIDIYKKGASPSGSSLTQRIEFLKAAFGIIKKDFWLGIGTGDLKKAFENQYKSINTQLDKNHQLRAHNQFVTFIITFGILGLFVILFSLFYPIIKEKGYKNYFFMTFFCIALLSMLNEDTLETQAGVTFFAFFYCFFIWGKEDKQKNIK